MFYNGMGLCGNFTLRSIAGLYLLPGQHKTERESMTTRRFFRFIAFVKVNFCFRLRKRLKVMLSALMLGKISVQPHPTLCIQFLNRENNDKNNTFPLGKQICFTMVWGCAETLPNALLNLLLYLQNVVPFTNV